MLGYLKFVLFRLLLTRGQIVLLSIHLTVVKALLVREVAVHGLTMVRLLGASLDIDELLFLIVELRLAGVVREPQFVARFYLIRFHALLRFVIV